MSDRQIIGCLYLGKPHHLTHAPVMLSELGRTPHARPIHAPSDGTLDSRPCHVCQEPLQRPGKARVQIQEPPPKPKRQRVVIQEGP